MHPIRMAFAVRDAEAYSSKRFTRGPNIKSKRSQLSEKPTWESWNMSAVGLGRYPAHNIPTNFNLDAGANVGEEPQRDVPAEKAPNVADSNVGGGERDSKAVEEDKIEKRGENDQVMWAQSGRRGRWPCCAAPWSKSNWIRVYFHWSLSSIRTCARSEDRQHLGQR